MRFLLLIVVGLRNAEEQPQLRERGGGHLAAEAVVRMEVKVPAQNQSPQEVKDNLVDLQVDSSSRYSTQRK